MEREEKLTREIKRLLRQIGAPRFLHHFGPKKYELKQHLFALLTAQIFNARRNPLTLVCGSHVADFSGGRKTTTSLAL